MLMAVLSTVASACPAGWTSSPANSCLLVPPERSASLFRCVDLCKERGGTPACIDSAAENAFVTEAFASTGDSLWLGLYQNETALGPARGWEHCVAGDAPSFTSWERGQPDDKAGFREDCARVDLNTGHWLDLACDGPQVRDNGAEALELSCLCARGNASAAFADDLGALEATRHYNRWLVSARTSITFIIAVAIATLPTLLLFTRAALRPRLRHAEPSVEVQGAAPETLPHALPSQSTTGVALDRRSSATSAAGVKRRLSAARKSAAGRRLRVSFAMVQAGWALFVIAVTPEMMKQTGQPIDVNVGDFLLLFPLGASLLLLALFPTDAIAIRIVCASVVVVGTGFALPISETAIRNHNVLPIFPFVRSLLIAGLIFALAGALVPTLWPRGSRAMQPRPALRRLWTAMRLFFLGSGLIWAGTAIAQHAFKTRDTVRGNYPVAVSTIYLMCFALATPRNRGRLHRRLGRLGGRGTEAEEAAAVAALVGGSNPDAALERASKLLRCLPAGRLYAEDLTNNTTAPPAGPTLHERTEPAAMGEVTAFLSHSWSDENEAPGAKHEAVSRWAARHREKTGNEPTLWLDKACIEQDNIEQALACLPIFLAGCKTLLVVVGATYCSRLWCVMELFTFVRSDRLQLELLVGGAEERVELRLIANPDQDQKEARRLLMQRFATFDAAEAQCFLARDRDRLLAVIEASFGDFYDFNRVVRKLFAKRVSDPSARRSSNPHLTSCNQVHLSIRSRVPELIR